VPDEDTARLAQIGALLANWLDAAAPLCEPLSTPGRWWSPGDLLDALQGQRADVMAELARRNVP
jgi:hypothetical protein